MFDLRHIAHGSIRHDLTAAYFWAVVRRSRSVQLIPFGGVAGLRFVGGWVGRRGKKTKRPTEERGDDCNRHQRHNHANDCSHHRRVVIHLMVRLDIDLQRRCGCAETGGKAAGPRSLPRNITSGNRPVEIDTAGRRNSSRQVWENTWRGNGSGGKRRYKMAVCAGQQQPCKDI